MHQEFFTLLYSRQKANCFFSPWEFFRGFHGGFREKFEKGWTALYRLIAFPCVETLEGCVKGWWKESKDKELNHSRRQRKADAGK